VFVYGTLMRGGHHHDVLQGARFVGENVTVPEFDLVFIDYYPALLRGGSTAVVGEVFEVDAATLQRLDALEEVPDYYLREPVKLADGSEVDCYVMPRARAVNATPIPSGDFRLHISKRA
jgi:gamma-glutamylcyclotransferase (GGCT)/AIG2-like uncharacterized protein YtfP